MSMKKLSRHHRRCTGFRASSRIATAGSIVLRAQQQRQSGPPTGRGTVEDEYEQGEARKASHFYESEIKAGLLLSAIDFHATVGGQAGRGGAVHAVVGRPKPEAAGALSVRS
jgi:hypothetical protein